MMTTTSFGHHAASAVRPVVLIPSTGVGRLRRAGSGGALVRRGAYGAPTSLPGDRTPALRRVLTP